MENGQWFAIVEGTDDYEVDVRLGTNNEVVSYSCNCPYDGEICKHIVAALYQIRDEAPTTETSKKSKEQVPWKNTISIIPEDELRKFLKEYAAKKADFRNVLMIRFSEYDNRDSRDKYSQIINGIFKKAEARNEYIDYHDTFDVMQKVFDLLAKAENYLEEDNFNETFYIAASVAPCCIDALQNMDDSNGECGGAINNAFEVISKILHTDASISLKNEIFDWLIIQANNPDYNDYGCADEMLPILVEAIDSPERAARVMAFLDDQLKKDALKGDRSSDYNTKKFLNLKMDVLKKTGKEKEAADIISKNMHIHDFRKIVVQQSLAEHNSDEAIRLIKEGINIATSEKYPGIIADWKVLLMDIYKQQNNIGELKAIAKELYFSGGYEMKYYLEYKSTFGKDDWAGELQKILNGYKKNEKGVSNKFQSFSYQIAAIYIEEKMWGELFDLLQKGADINTLLKYSPYLIKDFAQGLIPLFKDAIERMAEYASDRSRYQDIASYILKMAEIPGGKEPAMSLVNHLMEKFNKRPAMKDELKKILNL